MKTYTPKAKDISRNWHVIDAKDKILGRVSSEIAQLLIGKSKPYFAPHLDCGDYVVVINADKVKVTGNKLDQKVYYHHTNFPGGLRSENLKDRMSRKPELVIEKSVKGMLPKNKLQSKRLVRLKVFTGDKHPYEDKLKKKTEAKSS